MACSFVVTGFGPFAGASENPTEALVALLDKEGPGELQGLSVASWPRQCRQRLTPRPQFPAGTHPLRAGAPARPWWRPASRPSRLENAEVAPCPALLSPPLRRLPPPLPPLPVMSPPRPPLRLLAAAPAYRVLHTAVLEVAAEPVREWVHELYSKGLPTSVADGGPVVMVRGAGEHLPAVLFATATRACPRLVPRLPNACPPPPLTRCIWAWTSRGRGSKWSAGRSTTPRSACPTCGAGSRAASSSTTTPAAPWPPACKPAWTWRRWRVSGLVRADSWRSPGPAGTNQPAPAALLPPPLRLAPRRAPGSAGARRAAL